MGKRLTESSLFLEGGLERYAKMPYVYYRTNSPVSYREPELGNEHL